MVFRSKVDAFFVKFMVIAVLIIAASAFFPLFFEGGTEPAVIIILTTIFVIIVSFLLWTAFAVKYVFYPDHLFVKGGPFRSRILYKDITKVSPTTNVFTGYRILSSRDAIEIFYKTGILGSVTISPREKEQFLFELQKRCPQILIQHKK